MEFTIKPSRRCPRRNGASARWPVRASSAITLATGCAGEFAGHQRHGCVSTVKTPVKKDALCHAGPARSPD